MAYLTIPAYGYGGYLDPLGVTMHSAETPLRAGYAESIARNVFGVRQPNPANQTSATGMCDPQTVVRMLPDNVVAWHVGNGNPYSLGWEQAGYAAFDRATWLSVDGVAQMRLLADQFRAASDTHGIPKRWATWQEARDCAARGQKFGFITHDDNRLAFGGTTHTDPMPHYPKDVFIDLVHGSAPPAPEGEQDMIIVTADGKFPALLSGGIFVALDGNEVQSFQAAGLKVVKVRPDVYDAMSSTVNK